VLEKMRLIAGLRYEENSMSVLQILDQRGVDNREDGFESEEVLPALQLVYEFTHEMQVRLSYGRTLALPSFKELSPVEILDPFLGDVYQGNPDLKPSLIDNVDLRWEMFLEDGQLLAVSLFYKDMSNPIEVSYFFGDDVNGDGVIDDQDEQPFTRGNIVPRNAEEGKVYGIELEARYHLGNLVEWLEYINIGGNLSVIESEVSVPEIDVQIYGISDTRDFMGLSGFLANLDLSYNQPDWGTNITLSYNYTGERLALVNTTNVGLGNIFEKGVSRLNFIVSQDLGEAWTIKFTASNLLDPTFERYYAVDAEAGGGERIFSKYQRGRTFSLSLTYRF
jgi:TonB-dependent receptor